MKTECTAASVAEGWFDYIVVGGGSAGCVLASRLSESGVFKVLLVEAGPDYPHGREPDLVQDVRCRALSSPEYFWPLIASAASASPGQVPPKMMPYPQGRIMGGGSSINAMHAQRGEASDYDEWRGLGVIGWGWDDLMPYFNKLETDLDFAGPFHGSTGPVCIKRYSRDEWSQLSRAMSRVLARQGLSELKDANTEPGAGYAPLPLNATDRRMSSAFAYLTTAVRQRHNLAILAGTAVKRLVFEGRAVVGVELADHAGLLVRGGSVIVSSGAIHSPALLQRSGVGAAATLRAAGIEIVADRFGVGRKMKNHPMISLVMHLSRRARRQNDDRPSCLMINRFSSGLADCPPADMIINLWEYLLGPAPHNPLMRQFGSMMLLLNKPYSEGLVTIDEANPFGSPIITTNILTDERDRRRMLDGVNTLAAHTQAPEFAGLINDAFGITPGPLMAKLERDDWKGRTLSALGAIAMDGPASLRRLFLKNRTVPVRTLLEDRSALESFVIDNTHPGGHPSGTCRLGDPGQTDTVVDSRCKLIGVGGVRVVDASIFPSLMRAGTNIPAMMAGEKAAHMILEDHRA